MNRKNRTKHSLLASFWAFLLCVSMLIGTTLAWFTDSASSAGNKIQSGTLDLKLEELTDSGWNDISDSTAPLFDYNLWEPGYTDYTVLKITNDGTLALKWQAKLIHNGTLNELAEVIDVYVTEFAGTEPAIPTDLAAVKDWDYAGSLKQFVDNFETVTKGNLAAERSAYLGIALHMREKAGNEYQDKDLGTFDIHILATQDTVEPDGFEDNAYDEGAEYDSLDVFYSDLREAFAAIGGGAVDGDGTNAQSSVVSVRETASGYTVTLLKDITETAPLAVKRSVDLDLNGHILSFEQTQQGLVIPVGTSAHLVINGVAEGSGISITNDGYATAVQVNSGSCAINGGTYSATTTDVGTPAAPNACIQVSGGELHISNAVVTATDTDGGTANGVVIGAGCEATIAGSNITATAPNAKDVYGIDNKGVAVISNSTVGGYSHYTANAAGTDYASRSMGIGNEGTMTLLNCSVIGSHSGVRSTGTLLINGGTYEGYGHGGIYFSGAGTTSYVKNATVRYCEMSSGYIDDGVAGTNKAGVYIGGANNIIVYMDNCTLFGPYYPVVLRNSGGEKNNALYISNSAIEKVSGFRGFRIGGTQNALYIGSGNGFTAADKYNSSSYIGKVEETNTSYNTIVDSVFGN